MTPGPVFRPSGRRRFGEELREFLETVGGAVLLALFIMVFIGRAFTVDGPSMLPTLHDGERLVVDKITYRFRPPSRGDVVVFRYPADPGQYFVKRVIGLPGETIAIEDGSVYIDGRRLPEPYLEELPRQDFGPVMVPRGTYFVLGDNRNNSEDSRDPRVGFVPRNRIVGRALWRYWPLQRMGLLHKPLVFETFANAKSDGNP